MNRPEVLFLDEPTSGLDPQARRGLHGSIRAFREEGRAVLLTTHYIEEAHALCDRIAILHHGRIVATGRPDDLIAASPAISRLVVRTARPLDLERAARAGPAWLRPRQGRARCMLGAARVGPLIIELVSYLEQTGNELLDLQVRKPSLEEVFLELTAA